MAFSKITEQDREGKGNVGLPDTPNLTTSEMQEQMDSLPNLVIDKFNEFIDAINANTGAINLGATVPPGITAQANVQSILNAMVTNLALCVSAKHTHENKGTLDMLTSDKLEAYDRLVTLLESINEVQQNLTNSSIALPTSAAVRAFVDNYDMRTKILAAAYPVGSVYSSTGVDPTTVFGGSWSLIDTDGQGVKRFVRVG